LRRVSRVSLPSWALVCLLAMSARVWIVVVRRS
jgi:hypothetical protein